MVEKFLSIKEVAEIMGVQPNTIYNSRSDGRCQIPFVKRNGRVGILRSELFAYLANGEVPHG